MNALTRTAHGIALLGKPRAAQTVHVCNLIIEDGRATRIVLVTPFGQEFGSYYVVYSKRTLQSLEDGMAPEELELDECTADGLARAA